jgi:hypothetical protein
MKDPAFLFYPGDYLRDTQCLSEKSQVAYDRIMCEHMRNICISQQQLNFFTKRLSDEEKSELMFLLTPVDGGYQITWVAESICKRRSYSDSRRKNRASKTHNISLSYDEHMENENENVNIISSSLKERKEVTGEKETKEEVSWRTDYKIYMEELRAAWRELTNNPEWMAEKEKFNPGVDILLSLEKSCKEFWATEAGWKHKKKSRTKEIDWKSTFNNMLSIKSNRVYVRTNQTNGLHSGRNDAANARRELEALKDLSEAVLQNIAGNRN